MHRSTPARWQNPPHIRPEIFDDRTLPTIADGPFLPWLADAKTSEFTDRKKFKGELFTALSRL
jgi:hypothetical protein